MFTLLKSVSFIRAIVTASLEYIDFYKNCSAYPSGRQRCSDIEGQGNRGLTVCTYIIQLVSEVVDGLIFNLQ